VATVSRVVNISGKVSFETRTRVLSAISELRYSPNVHASELARVKGGTQRKLDSCAHLGPHGDRAVRAQEADTQDKPEG
jgi:hypothetical protein